MSLPIVESVVAARPEDIYYPPTVDTNTIALLQADKGFADQNGVLPYITPHPREAPINTSIVGPFGALGAYDCRAGDYRWGPFPEVECQDPLVAGEEIGYTFEFWGRFEPGKGPGEISIPYLPFSHWKTNDPTGALPAYSPTTPFLHVTSWRANVTALGCRWCLVDGRYVIQTSANSMTYGDTSGPLGNGWHHFAVVVQNHPTLADAYYIAFFLNGTRTLYNLQQNRGTLTSNFVDASAPVYLTLGYQQVSDPQISYFMTEVRLSRIPRYDAAQTTITVPAGSFTLD